MESHLNNKGTGEWKRAREDRKREIEGSRTMKLMVFTWTSIRAYREGRKKLTHTAMTISDWIEMKTILTFRICIWLTGCTSVGTLYKFVFFHSAWHC